MYFSVDQEHMLFHGLRYLKLWPEPALGCINNSVLAMWCITRDAAAMFEYQWYKDHICLYLQSQI